jgi:hypothetical protein
VAIRTFGIQTIAGSDSQPLCVRPKARDGCYGAKEAVTGHRGGRCITQSAAVRTKVTAVCKHRDSPAPAAEWYAFIDRNATDNCECDFLTGVGRVESVDSYVDR